LIDLIFGKDREIERWVAQRIGLPGGFGPCTAIGVVKNGEPCAGVIYSHYSSYTDPADFNAKPVPIRLEMSVAAIRRDWLNRETLRGIFAYPFIQIGVGRVQSTIAADNQHAIDFNLRLGFTKEADMKRAYFDGRDAVMTSMLRENCKWIKE
jgi:RimJ/RimL family protein N-acetyltransferase